MRRISTTTVFLVIGAFLTGFLSHLLYQRWTSAPRKEQGYPVTFSPLPPATQSKADIPLVEAAELEKVKALSGNRARVRGRIYRVGHSTKSDTYFLNFGPSRSSFTGVIFSSALLLFEQSKIHPKDYEGREVELTGNIKDDPKYGLEMILEEPSQIKLLD
ncbi:MAG: hypothetical protein ACE5I0_01550 [Candidatus Binatia bacterium]